MGLDRLRLEEEEIWDKVGKRESGEEGDMEEHTYLIKGLGRLSQYCTAPVRASDQFPQRADRVAHPPKRRYLSSGFPSPQLRRQTPPSVSCRSTFVGQRRSDAHMAERSGHPQGFMFVFASRANEEQPRSGIPPEA
nr:hypothetical protein CFP56_03377 [Quercus suber]